MVRHKISVDARACSGRHAGREEDVLDPDRYSQERRSRPPIEFGLPVARFGKYCFGIDMYPSLDVRQGFDPVQECLTEFDRGDLSLPDSGCRFSNAQFVQRPQRNAGPVRVTTGGDRCPEYRSGRSGLKPKEAGGTVTLDLLDQGDLPAEVRLHGLLDTRGSIVGTVPDIFG